MTISSSTNVANFTCNGATTAFPFQYVFFQPGDLLVLLYNTTSLEPVTPQPAMNGAGTYDYTVVGTQDSASGEYLSGATIVCNTAPPANYTLSIQRSMAPTQQSAFLNNTLFPAKAVEAAFDRVTMLIQQVLQALKYALTAPLTDFNPMLVLPASWQRANKVLGFDAQGNVQTISGIDQSANTVTAASGTQAATLAQRFNQELNAKTDFGAQGNGASDDTQPLLNMIAALQANGGGRGYIPPGNYPISSMLRISASDVKIRGAGRGAWYNSAAPAAATRIFWNGLATGQMVQIAPGGALPLDGCEFTDIMLDSGYPGGVGCQKGIELLSVRKSVIKVTVLEFGVFGVHLGCVAGLTDPADCQNNDIDIDFRQEYSNGYPLGLDALIVGGVATANASFNTIRRVRGVYSNGYGIYIGSGDNNIFENVQMVRTGGSVGTGVVLGASNTPGNFAASNLFLNLSAGAGGVFAEGTGTATYPSIGTKILAYDKGNGNPDPLIDIGAGLSWASNILPGNVRAFVPGAGSLTEIDENGVTFYSGVTPVVAANGSYTVTFPTAFGEEGLAFGVTATGGGSGIGPFNALLENTGIVINQGAQSGAFAWWAKGGGPSF
jgi:hypothetical protein